MSKAIFFADPFAKVHDTGPGHVESSARWDAALRGLEGHEVIRPPSREATYPELEYCHDRTYIDHAKHDVDAGYSSLHTGDTDICPKSFEVARRGVGLVLSAVDQIMTGPAKRAFCVVRPPGHHATANTGMGFCLFNQVAIAARYAQKKYGVHRVLIADWDVHHGNGTQDIFYEDPSVYFFSTHQYPWYPGTGAMDETGHGRGTGTTMNMPFAAGAGRDEILGAFEKMAWEMQDFKPEFVLLSAGFDSRAGDPLGHFLLEDKDFQDLTTMLLEIADKYAHGHILSSLEGGYSLSGLAAGVSAHAKILATT